MLHISVVLSLLTMCRCILTSVSLETTYAKWTRTSMLSAAEATEMLSVLLTIDISVESCECDAMLMCRYCSK